MIGWLIRTVIVVILAGYLANKIMQKDSSDAGKNLVLGLIGSVVGALIGWLIGLRDTNIIGSIIMAVVGACVATWAASKIS